jgi:arylsulfatase A-like enzyme
MRLGLPRPLLAAVLAVVGLAGTCSAPPSSPPSLLLVTVDTLRADHLTSYGYPRRTSPRIDALASRGVVFEHLIAPLPETSPTFASMLTGRWPAELGIRGNARPLATEARTLAEILSDAGYHTAAFVSGFPLVRKLSGLDQGFSHFDDAMPDPRGAVAGVQRLADKTTDAALAWSRQTDRGPFFMWVHYYDPHGNYHPGPNYEELFVGEEIGPTISPDDVPLYQRVPGVTDAAVYIALYDAEIRKTDTEIGRLIDALEQDGRMSNTLVVLTADHGESLTEHGYYFDHGNELYTPSLHVPLVLSGPGIPAGRRVEGVIRTPDLFPTLLDALSLATPEAIAGRSFLDAANGRRPLERRESFSEARFAPYQALTSRSDVKPKIAVRDDRFTAVLRVDDDVVELYDRAADPAETTDLLASEVRDPSIVDEVRALLNDGMRARLSRIERRAMDDRPVFDDRVRRRLEEFAERVRPSD